VDRYFYESFTDKEALFLQVFDRVCDELFAAVAEAVAEVEPTAADQLRAAIGTFLREMERDPRKPRLIFSEPAAVGVDAEAHMRTTLRQFAALASATAREHVPGGTPGDIVRLVGLAVVGTIERVVIEWQDGELDKPIDQIEDDCVTLFLRLLDT
jgi:AcrR family transcriptional regulator